MASSRIPAGYRADYQRPAGVDERIWAGLLCTGLLVSYFRGLSHATILAGVLGTLAAAIWIDALSYFVHRALDNHEFAGHAVLSRLAAEFQVHHARPGDVVKRGYLRNNTMELCFYIAIPQGLPAAFCDLGSAAQVFFLASAVWASFVPTIHAWSHHPRNPNRAVALLQRLRVILSPATHSEHHRGLESEFRSYALLNGWTNGVLNRYFAGAPSSELLEKRAVDYR